MSVHGESLSSVTIDQQLIPCKNKRKKNSYTYITGKESNQESYNSSKRTKEDSIPNVEKLFQKKHLHRLEIRKTTFGNKEDYIGDTNEKTHGSDVFPSETDGCARNLAEEHEHEEDEEFSENNSEIKDSNKSKISKGITEEDVIISLLSKIFSIKVIQAVILSIDTYEQDILSFSKRNKKNKSNTN